MNEYDKPADSLDLGLLDDVMGEISSKKVFGKWKNWTIEDFKNCYDENYAGMTPSQLTDDEENGGRRFYRKIKRLKLQDQIFDKPRVHWKGWSVENFKSHYDEKYAGMTKTEVRNNGPDGTSFYKVLFRKGLLDEVFSDSPNELWKKYSDEELGNYAKENYAGLTRSSLDDHKNKKERLFFLEVQRRGLLDEILPLHYKPRGYWKDENNVFERLTSIISTFGKVPTTTELIKIDSGLLTSIGNYHGGYKEICKKMGHDFPRDRQANGYWTKEKTIEIARELHGEYGRIPVRKKLEEIKLSSFPSAVRRHFGNLQQLKEILSLEQEESTHRELLESIGRDLCNE